MHGRPRKSKISQEDEQASAAKAAKLRSFQSQFLQFHHSKTYTKEALEVSVKLLELNPEHYTAWNYRKLAIENCISTDPESIGSVLEEELKVVENALRRNYKAYGAWHHRTWVLEKGHCSTDRELGLLAKFQKADPRNFHAWNYRRFITKLKKIPEQEELQHTSDVINDNFSNYSAWHNRSVLLSHLLEERVEGYSQIENVLKDEYKFVRNAIFTDPDDQSGWFYHLWLLEQTLKITRLSISSWPSHGSNIHVSSDAFRECSSFNPCALSAHGLFPFILYFDNAVEGIDSSTVVVQCEYNDNNDYMWRPVQVNKYGQANVWVTCLNFPIKEMHPSKPYGVKVSIAQSVGIMASDGIQYSNPLNISFTVWLLPHGSESDEVNHLDRIFWGEENYSLFEPCDKELDLISSSCQMTMSENYKSEAYVSKVKKIIDDDEIPSCRELLKFERDCKIGKLTLARLLMAHDALVSCNETNDLKKSQYEEVLKLYEDLMILDPPHFQYYKDQHSLVFLIQETSNMESLLRYCRRYRDDTCPSTTKYVSLCLNNLSISRIGCFARLLWVRMLDLSHNELRSIEGLEAMQLLCCLNLSNNKLCTFSALEPLQRLESLKVLDVSFNEIGVHSVDSRRYLFSSPLSHTVESGWKSGESGASSAEIADYWEAFIIFKGLKLTQLDIVGNPIVDEKFKLFLCKLLPGLRWLDGNSMH